MKFRPFLLSALALLATAARLEAAMPAAVGQFIQKHCFECHDADLKKGGLDLTAQRFELSEAANFALWAKVHDRVSNGEMPPGKKARPAVKELKAFTNSLAVALIRADQIAVAKEGRATQRRLNRYEYEQTLRDLLALPYLEVKEFLPEDSESHGFNKLGEALDVSHVQMARYLTAAEFALRQAMAPQTECPKTTTNRYYTWEEGEFFGRIKLEGPGNRRTFPLVDLELQRDLMAQEHPKRPKVTDPERRNAESMAVVVSTYEPTEIRFGRFRAPFSGRYRLRFSARSIWMNGDYTNVSPSKRNEPVTIYAERPPRALRKLGSFDVTPEPTEQEMDVWLLAGETLRPDAARLFRSRPPNFKNPLATPEGMPGVAFGWLQTEGPLIEHWPPAGHELLFGDLPLKTPTEVTNSTREVESRGVEAVSLLPELDATRLLRRFMQKAYRRPLAEGEVERFLGVVRSALKVGHSFTEAMLAGYTGVLSSPAFLYFSEKPGPLEDRALAERLSYFLWNSCPDTQLRTLAEGKRLHRPEVLRQQVNRLLDDSRSRCFVDAFLNYWLDLRLIDGTAPDSELYPDYQLDDLLVESMTEETQSFFEEILQRNLSVTNLVATDFAVLNERLATHYKIPGLTGVRLRDVYLPAGCVRGGLLTQASILKVTSNGTTTSPVKRGAWIMARLLGKPPPPPPASVSAIDPDIRGATTIREQLAKHRNQASCAACHRNIDPAGFALESFDVMGGWRERYRSVGEGERVKGSGHNGISYNFCLGPAVDSSGELPDGRRFEDIRGLKQLLLSDPEQLARNLLEQLSIYATGAPMRFSDRPVIAQILARCRAQGYGVRSLVHELVQSELFLNK